MIRDDDLISKETHVSGLFLLHPFTD